MIKRALPLLLLPLAVLASSAQAADLWFNAGGVSYHDKPGRNPYNPGAGLELRTSDDLAFAAGVYRNSHDLPSRYVGVIYTPLKVSTPVAPIYMGVQVGGVDGYPINDGKAMLAAAATAELRSRSWCIALVYVPAVEHLKNANMVALQFKRQIGGLW